MLSAAVHTSYLFERADEGRDAHDSSVSEQLGHLRDSADVLLPVLRGEAQVLVEPRADVVPIQTIGRNPLGNQVLLQRKGDGGLPRPRQTGQPDGAPSEPTLGPQHLPSLVSGHMVFLEGHIRGPLYCLKKLRRKQINLKQQVN